MFCTMRHLREYW